VWTPGFLVILSLALGIGAWLLEDPEGPKYRMLDDEDDHGEKPGG
jgi:hypothetical protein